ncbi:hypothetical protein [Bartonella sp. HY038]|uniref:hypothetical protein n=1 Tax=Bartonella sp. HY038 TaxID=2759660 RepID=UPI0015F802FC|nr:hypothetical protein [Bartonella sp. HY038]
MAGIAVVGCVGLIIACMGIYSTHIAVLKGWFGDGFETLNFEIASKISIGVIGIITLGVVVWRGALHAMQEKTQAKQLAISNDNYRLATDNLIETQNNNLAKLLVDATKLLGADTTDAEKTAAVICLSYIIDVPDKNNVFARQAVKVLKLFVNERARQSPNGMNCDGNPIEFEALDVIDKYNKNNGSAVVLHDVTIKGDKMLRGLKMWPNTKGIIYDNYTFMKEIFDEKYVPFRTKNCKFFKCTFNQQNKFIPVFITVNETTYDPITGECNEYEGISYPYENVFQSCLFGTSTSTSHDFRIVRAENFYNFDFGSDCLFNDEVLTDASIVNGFIKWGIRPLSNRDVDAPPLVPPSVT